MQKLITACILQFTLTRRTRGYAFKALILVTNTLLTMTKEEQIIAFSRSDAPQWFVMRDLKRNNAKLPAYKMLSEMKIEIFTPMKWKIVTKEKKRIPQKVPFMQDLLFVHVTRKILDPIVERTSTLQYRYLRDGFRTPMTVRDTDMERFIRAVESADNPQFYAPKDILPSMIGKTVRIIGGPLNDYVGKLQKMQGSKVKRIFIELSNLLTASIEVQPEYIQIL